MSIFQHLPWVFSMKITFESALKFWPVRIICWPPRTEQASMSCFSTMGSSWADLWAIESNREKIENVNVWIELNVTGLNPSKSSPQTGELLRRPIAIVPLSEPLNPSLLHDLLIVTLDEKLSLTLKCFPKRHLTSALHWSCLLNDLSNS